MRFKGWGLGLTITGVVLVVFAVVWLFAIFPGMVKLPSDYNKDVRFEGTYLVFNSATYTMDELPVNVQRLQLATGVENNVLIISETVTCTHAIAGVVLPQFGQVGSLSVDCSTRAYVADQDDGMPRSGQFCFPSDLQHQSYQMWISSAGRPLEAEFVGEEEFEGLNVYVFQISEEGLSLGTDEATGMPRVLDITVDLRVEPVSGTTVYTASYSTYSFVLPDDTHSPYYISNIAFTQGTIDELVNDAISARSLILWLSFYGFWIVIGVGAALVITGVVLAARARG
jgi:hypothetical protein